jgi:hypothetical protein
MELNQLWKSMKFMLPVSIPGNKKVEEIGEEGFHHGMTPQHYKRIRELELTDEK